MSFRSARFAWTFVVIFAFYFYPVYSAVDLNPNHWQPIRSHINQCRTFLALAAPTINDSVGILLSASHREEDFRRGLEEVISVKGKDSLKGSVIFITGVDMAVNETEAALPFRRILAQLDLDQSQITLKIFSYPKAQVRDAAIKLASSVFYHVKAWFPSMRLDYQNYQTDEVTIGLASTAAIEAPNAVYIYKSMPRIDSALTLMSHAVILTAYTLFTKSLTNWLLRPGATKFAIRIPFTCRELSFEPGTFLKQLSVSAPFIFNYTLLGNTTKITQFYRDQGWEAILHALPAQTEHFLATQTLTAFLQTIFYNTVIIKGIGAWQNSQKGNENSRLARGASAWVKIPPLILDSIALAMAAKNAHPLFKHWGLELNTGHAALFGLTLTGSTLIYFPRLLNPTLWIHKRMLASLPRSKRNSEGALPLLLE